MSQIVEIRIFDCVQYGNCGARCGKADLILCTPWSKPFTRDCAVWRRGSGAFRNYSPMMWGCLLTPRRRGNWGEHLAYWRATLSADSRWARPAGAVPLVIVSKRWWPRSKRYTKNCWPRKDWGGDRVKEKMPSSHAWMDTRLRTLLRPV